jgi:hypothetical protein
VLSAGGPSSLSSTFAGVSFGGVDITDDDLRQIYQQSLSAIGSRLPKLTTSYANSIKIGNPVTFQKAIDAGLQAKAYNWLQKDKMGAQFFEAEFGKSAIRPPSLSGDDLWNLQTSSRNTRIGARIAGYAMAFAGVAGIVFSNIKGSKTLTSVAEVALQSVAAASATMDAVTTFSELATKVKFLNSTGLTAGNASATIFSVGQSLKSSAGKAGAIGAVIGVGVSWVLFFAAWGAGGLAVGSVAFNSLLAGAISGAILAVVIFIVSLTVVGAIILAVFAIFDLFALIACKAGAKTACDIGITAAITKALSDWLYTGGMMIDTSGKPPITSVYDLDMRLTDPQRGMVVGNGVLFEAQLETIVRHLAPEPGVIYFYSDFFTQDDIRSTSVKYALGPAAQPLKSKLNETYWQAFGSFGQVTADVPSPVPLIGALIPIVKTKDLWQAARFETVASPVYPFTNANINQTFPVTLSIGMALPTYDCWFSVCKHKSAQTISYQNLSDSLVLDVLPASLTDFYNWSQLGPQIDRDGDGLPARVDPDPLKWDTDGDGLSDKVELDYLYDPRLADADSDGLGDIDELRNATNPRKADTDGDGITDKEEIEGYALTIAGQTVRTTSDPTLRDSDTDGISDGAERRLNIIDPVRYPFHPLVFSESPARIYSMLSDVDRVLAVGATTTITTTVFNGMAVENALMASGVFSAVLPAELGGAIQSRSFTLLPTTRSEIVLNGTAGAGQRFVAVNTGVAADLVPVGNTPDGIANDIILDSPVPVTIDSDDPDAPVLTLGAFVQPGNTVIIGGTASDPTSYISLVEVSVNGGSFSTATGTGLWAFPVAIPNATGAVPIAVRVTDAVNHVTTASFNLTIDGVSPDLAVNLNAGDFRRVRRNATGAWSLRMSGTAADSLAGMSSLSFQIGDSAAHVVTTTVIAQNGSWTVDYPFSDLNFNADPRPTGIFTATITARDNALPDGNPATRVIPFVIDMTPPTVALLSHQNEMQLTDGAVITGTVVDAHSPVTGVEVAFVAAETALATGNTLLRLPLNDLPETVLFDNNATIQTRVFCLDISCPTSGQDGADGTAVTFGGDDLLRTFEPLDLPENGLSTALWFNTSCANCGLFSLIQGVYPAVAEHDRELFLASGNVCSSLLVGVSREVRCSTGANYADGQWHQVIHTLGDNGNALYVDGQLAASSPTTASTFAAQDALLIGYAPAAATPFLTGALDDIVIYEGALPAESAMALYRQWRPVTVTGNSWSFAVPAGLEGYYQVDMRATDAAGNSGDNRSEWPQFRGPIDTRFPSFDIAAAYQGSGSSAQTVYRSAVNDYNLTTAAYEFVCPLANDQLRYDASAAQLAFTGVPSDRLSGIVAQCISAGFQTSLVAASACDTLGHCGAAVPPQSLAYIGTYNNRVLPFGSLPNAIERANLSDPGNRVRLIERPGSVIVDIAVDESRDMLYWAEMVQGDYAQPGSVWRANLDGSGPQQLVSGLTVYGAEALQIALDPVGNKLYWTKGHELWWANLDGTLPQLVYAIAGAVPGVSQIGDVVVDGENGRLYLSERRRHGTLADYNAAVSGNVTYIPFHGRKHTLIVTANLNGTNPEFFAGVGAGCTYANFYDNQGTGTGLGLKPTTCLISGTDGFDVEALAVSNGTLYWSAIDGDGINAGVYGRAPGQPSFPVAPLALPGNANGLRTTPLPQLYVDDTASGVFVQLPAEGFGATDIVRGEAGGEFTRFASFLDTTPAAPGSVRRSQSSLSAMAVIVTAQATQTDTDLAVGITSPALVMVDGDTARYDITLRNDAALSAAGTVLTLTLPVGGSYAGASHACVGSGATVTCDFGRFAALTQQSVAISFTIATTAVRELAATVSVASATVERTPANNSATHSRITAAPTLAALPGTPYIYYGDVTRLTRVPLFGSFTAEPLFLDPPVSGEILAADLTRNRLYIVTALDRLIAVNPDGSNRVELANTNQVGLNTSNRQRVTVDETTGRVYWSEIKSLYLTTIKSANPDGTGVLTVIDNVLNQRGLLVDPIRRRLLWVGSDQWQRQELIFRSNLDGSNPEVVYGAPEGTQIRELALDPYAQKLYWLDPTSAGGTLFWADADGNRPVELATGLGNDARGLIVRPFENALYYVRDSGLMRAELDGSNEEYVANLSQRPYTGLYLPVNPTSFGPTYINRPTGNLAFVIAAPFAAPPCVMNDSHEPNNSAGAAKAIGLGVTTGALCTIDAALPQDRDFYTVTVPNGKLLNATLSGLPANYDLYVQRAGVTLAISQTAGLANETIALSNYEDDGAYTVVVFSSSPVNNGAPYTLTVGLTDAPPQTVFSAGQCLAVDPADAAGLAGNSSQGQATPLTVGSVITGALCYQNDVDFFAFNAITGQRLTLDLPTAPEDYELHVYRPDGSFVNAFNRTGVWTYPALVSIDATGTWAVAVRLPTLTPTLSPYQLLVTDSTCSINDPWEPNNSDVQAASLGAPGRVHATLCAANDMDNFRISATAGQTLTVNYPANAAGAVLRLLNGAGAEMGRILPGNQGNFVLPTAGNYTLVAANSALTSTDTAYMFQWLLDAPQVAPDQQYLYYTDGLLGQLYRVALSADHTTEPIFLTTTLATAGPALAADGGRNLLYSYNPLDGDGYIVRSNTNPFDGSGYVTVVTAPNPDGVGVPPVAVAVDESTGRIYWVQPRGGSFSTGSTIRRANSDGTDNVAIIGAGVARTSLVIDSIRGLLYWTENGAILRSDLDGAGVTTLRAAVVGQTPTDLALDPFAQRLYWLDATQRTIYRANADGSSVTALVTGLDANARGVAVQPQIALYYSNGGVMLQAALDGSNPLTITTLAGAYNGPSNLDPDAFPLAVIAPPQSQLTIGSGRPLVSPCTLADSHEPNNDPVSATPLTVVTATVTYGALCNSVLGQPADWDYYTVTVASQKILSVTLSELPANYRVIVRNAAGLNLAFSDNDGLADDFAAVSNTSSTTTTYTILVLGYGFQNTSQYKLTLALGDVPPPPGPSNEQCSFVDVYDTPGTGNGTLATATPLPFDTLLTAALCYTADMDMYSFDGLNGQTLTIDLPLRPQDYNVTLYAPSGAATAVISATTTPAYGGSVTLTSSGRYTVSVSQPNLTPTEAQYQLLVTDENCVASDANEPNDSAAFATLLSNGSRVRATLCSAGDVDLYVFSATSGQQLTLNYPANATGAVARVVPVAGGADLGQVTAGGQGIFIIPADGDYRVMVENVALTGSAVPYQFELLLGTPTPAPSGSPYIYYSRVSDLVRTAIVTGTVEPILLSDTFGGGSVLTSDPMRGKLYILDYLERIVRANPDGSGAQVVVADTDPNDVLRFTESLAVDERSGRIYWVQPSFGVVGDILSANGDGSDVQTVVTGVVYDHGIAIDPVGGRVYWAQTTLHDGLIVDHIRRSNLDGTNVETVYAAPEGRQIRELTVDPFAQTLYWRDPTQNRLLQTAADGSGAEVTVANVGSARGFVVRPLQNELYYTADSQLWRAARDGSSPLALARLDGAYNGASSRDSNAFYPTILTPPGSNLALAFGAPFVTPCSTVDGYEPNNTLATAAAITPGGLSAALCTDDLTNSDDDDYYKLTVASGQQITVTLTDLPQDYGLILIANGNFIAQGFATGTDDEVLTHINRTGAPAVYTALVLRNLTPSTRLPYTLDVAVADAPPNPCSAFDVYDAPGELGNQTPVTATLITVGATITAALCYDDDADYYAFSGDVDNYAFDGIVGQQLTVDLAPKPAEYGVNFYNPAGQLFKVIPPQSLNYGSGVTLPNGGSFILEAAGRYTVEVFAFPRLPSTTGQYALRLSSPTCTGLDPYEPNDNEFGNAYAVSGANVTLRTMLCGTEDRDWYNFALEVGDRVRITPRVLTNGTNSNGDTVNMNILIQPPGSGFGEITEPYEMIASSAGDFLLGVYTQPRVNNNLRYEIDVQITPAPARPTPPNNWTCTVYPSSDIPRGIEDLTTLASTVNVTASGSVTWVGLKDITFDHGGLSDVAFGLAAPDGAQVDLFAFEDYGNYNWCGGSNCQLSIDDWAIEGLAPPQFPNDGGTFRPSRNSFAPFNGKASSGVWTFYVSDDGLSDLGGDAGDTTGDLLGWSLEVCVDNGAEPDPIPTATPTPTPAPRTEDGAPPTVVALPVVIATPTPPVCVAAPDLFENDNSAPTASLFDIAVGSSAGHNFHTVDDADWYTVTLLAGLQYTLTATTVNPAQVIALSLYGTDGTTHLQTQAGQLVFMPPVTGSYYVRAASGSGLSVSLCQSGYSLVLASVNPNATPVPTPVAGAALPLGHDAPPLSAAVLVPADGAVLTQTQPVTVEVGLNAENIIQSAELFANGVSLGSYTEPFTNTDLIWPVAWTPPQAGVYSLTAVLVDSLNVVTTSTANTVYVDLAGPAASIISETITLVTLESDGSYRIEGTAGDDSQVDKVEVRLDGGPWQAALLSGSAWSLALEPLLQANPDGGVLLIEVLVTDKAGRTASATAGVILDVTLPGAFTSVASLISSGTVISPGQLSNELGVRLAWPAITGTASVFAGWTDAPTATLGALTAYGPAAGAHDQTMPEAGTLYAHVVAVDAHGNQRVFSRGPFFFDSAQTPDLIADLAAESWVESGGKQVGQMASADRGVQKLYAGWDANQLRLRWEGFDINSEGDLALYLGTGGGGTTGQFNPSGADPGEALPFAATYMVRLASGITPTLYAFSGGAWVTQTEVVGRSSGELNDVLLSFADLGIANPAVASLQVVGVIAEMGTPDVWATAPDQNLGRSWAQYVEFASLGVGIVPADGVWADTLLEAVVSADPAPAALVGVGDPVNVTVALRNAGSAILPSLTVNGTGTGGLSLSNTPQTAANLAPSNTVTLTLNGVVNADGTMALTLADSYHRAYALQTLAYQVDASPPVSVSLAISYVTPGINTVLGFALDESEIGEFALEVNGTIIPCPVPGLSADTYACLWDVGGAAEGTSFTLRVRATDIHGNESWSAASPVQVDATPPQLSFSAATVAALSDNRLGVAELALTGSLTDTLASKSAELCTDDPNSLCSVETVLPDDSWTLVAPGLGDGVTATLAFVGYDVAGNASQPVSKTVVIDSVSPQFGAATINQAVFVSSIAAPLGSGAVTDGSGVAAVQLFVVRPDGSSTIAPATLSGATWQAAFVFDQTGLYQALVVATDLAGNKAAQSAGFINAGGTPPARTLTVTVVGNGVVTPATGVYVSGTTVPLTATAATGWSFSGWSGALVTTTNPSAITLDADKVITATFAVKSYTLLTATVGGGAIALNPPQASYLHGSVVTATALANSGNAFAGWSGAATGSNNPVTVTVTGNQVITAAFTPIAIHGLTVSVVGNGAVTPASSSYVTGTVVPITATAAPGWRFSSWSGDLTGTANPALITLDRAKSVVATFTQDVYTVNSVAVGGGVVSLNPQQGGYLYGAVVTATATADAGWVFAGWSGAASGAGNPVTVFVAGNQVITGTFTPLNAFALTVNVTGGGSVNRTPDQASYTAGSVVTLTAVANTDALFTGWGGDAGGTANPLVVTMNGNKNVTAAFVTPKLEVFAAQPGVVRGGAMTIVAAVMPALPGLTVNFTIAGGGGSLDAASATTGANGIATVVYTAPANNALVKIDGVLAAAPAVSDSGYLYVGAASSDGRNENSASGVYTIGNLIANHIQIVKYGVGAPRLGWSEFAGNPCPASTPGARVVSPYVDVMMGSADDVDAVVVTLRYTDTVAAGQHRPFWCNNGTWAQVNPAAFTVDRVNNTLVFTLTSNSSPTLLQLLGTPFVGVGADVGVEPSSIGDFIWNDLNKNGLADTAEPGVSNVEVTLWRADAGQVGQPGSGVSGTAVTTTTTDALGRYTFTGLEEGYYYVTFGLPGNWRVSLRGDNTDNAFDNNAGLPNGGYSVVFFLAAGSDDLAWDAGIYDIEREDPTDLGETEEPTASNNKLYLPVVGR